MSIFATHRAIAALREDLTTLSLEVAHLQSANKQLGLEWEELYDKVRHQMSRMSKRVAVDTPVNDDVSETVDALISSAGVDPISAKILARRGIQRQAE